MLNNKIKGIFSLVSSVFTQLIIGNGFTFGNFVYYYKSFLHYKNINNISVLNLLYIAPISAACFNVFPIVTGYLDKTLKIRILTIMATLSILTSQLIIYYNTKYYLMIIAYIFYGFAGSITYLPTLKNCWKYYPNKKGMISGIIFSSCGLSVFIFTSIGDFIINPKAEGKNSDGFYSKEVSMRYTQYLKFFISCVVILGTISSILSFPYEEEDILKKEENIEDEVGKITIEENIDIQDKENEKNEDENIGIINDEKDNRYSVQSNKAERNKNNKSVEKEEEKLTVKESLLSIQFLQCFFMVGCTLLFGFLLNNTYRPFGNLMKLNEFGMQSLSKTFTLLNTFSRLLWGYLYDKFGFKYLYLYVCINQIVCSSLIYFSARSIYTYFLCCNFGVLSFSGHVILFPNLVRIKFGIENSITLLGVCGIFGGTTCLLGPVLTSSIIKKNSDYLKTFLIAGSTTFVSLILTFVIKIEKMKKNVLLIEENKAENITENKKEDSEEISKDTPREKNKENTIENSQDVNVENGKDNNIKNNEDNKKEKITENTQSSNTEESTPENMKDNNSDNINNEVKEENITENLAGNKEEKLIDK